MKMRSGFLLLMLFLACALAGWSQRLGSVTVTADPNAICVGESSGLHASYLAPDPILFDFEDGMQGWTTIDADGYGDAWSRYNYDAYGGSFCMRASWLEDSSPYHNHSDYLVSPQITLGVGTFSFYARRYTDSGSYQSDSFRVYLSTSGNSNASDFTIELTNGDVLPNTTYEKFEYDLSSYQGEGYVAIVYTAPGNQFYLYVDDITIYDDGSTVLNGTTYGFENGSLQGWKNIDADGDGNKWKIGSQSNSYSLSIPGHSNSSHCVYSESFVFSEYDGYYIYGTIVTPDNYLVSPSKITIHEGAFISFWACGVYSWPFEHFGVAISFANNPTSGSSFTTIQEWTMTSKGYDVEMSRVGWSSQTAWRRYTVDLSAYTGQSIWVAIRHFNSTDQFYLGVDDITIYEGSDDPGGDENITYQWDNGMTGPNITVFPTQTTTYTVTAYQDGNYVGSASKTVAVYSDPNLSITTDSGGTAICEEDTITLRATVDVQAAAMEGDILCTDGSFVKPSEWPVAGKTAKGIVFYVDATGQHGWAVHLQQSPKMRWSSENVSVSGLRPFSHWLDALADVNGYSNTQRIRSTGDASKYPAAWAVDFQNGWYLPSIGQLNVLYGSLYLVNSGLDKVGGTPIVFNEMTTGYWSSSTSSLNNYSIMLNYRNGSVEFNVKIKMNYVRSITDF